jgi:hypothetical protein
MTSRAQSLPLIRLTILTVASLTICRADPKAAESLLVPQETQSTTAVRHIDWRKALNAEFKYTPATPPDPAVPPEAIPETPANPDVVVLPKYVVRDAPRRYRELERVIRDEEEDARSEALNRKFGIRTYVFKYRKVIFGYKTLFFIPVGFGAAW